MAWTAASIIPSVGSVVTRRSGNTPAGNAPTPGQQVGSSMPNVGSSSQPAFLDNPAAFLGGQMFPYEDLLARILGQGSQPSSNIPPELAQAYAAQANAQAERLQLQNAATKAFQDLPNQIAQSQAREAAVMPWSLSGLPTGLGYRDPLTAMQDNTFALRARAFGAPAPSTLNSGWLSPGLY